MGLVDASSWRTSRLERRADVPKGRKVDHPRSDSMLDMEAASVASAPTWTENGRTPPGSTPPPKLRAPLGSSGTTLAALLIGSGSDTIDAAGPRASWENVTSGTGGSTP